MKYNEVHDIEKTLKLVKRAVEVGNYNGILCGCCPIYRNFIGKRCGKRDKHYGHGSPELQLRNKIIKAFKKWIELVENKEITS